MTGTLTLKPVATYSSGTAISKAGTTGTITPGDYQVNPPYTPKIKHLSLEYTSSLEIPMDTYSAGSQADQADRVFYIQPFGYSEVQREAGALHYSFLPQYNAEGELYIGIRDLRPPQDLALLFQLAEGSANPDL